MRILIFDPSGNWGKEGMGTTGWSLFENGELKDFGHISANKFIEQEAYWLTHISRIDAVEPDLVICESYRLQAGKAMAQSWSTLDTPQLIGYLRMHCWYNAIGFEFQNPSDKTRVADPQLEHMGILEKRNGRYYCLGRQTIIHERDSIRHGTYFFRYGKGKGLLHAHSETHQNRT